MTLIKTMTYYTFLGFFSLSMNPPAFAAEEPSNEINSIEYPLKGKSDPCLVTEELWKNAWNPVALEGPIEQHFSQEIVTRRDILRQAKERKSLLTIYTLEQGETHKGVSCILEHVLRDDGVGLKATGRIRLFENPHKIIQDLNGLEMINFIGTNAIGHMTYIFEYKSEEELTGIVIPHIGVDVQHRGKGLAEAMLQKIIDFATENTGARFIGTNCRTLASAALFEKKGFIKDTTKPPISSEEMDHILEITRQ